MTDPEVACRAHNIYATGKDYRRLNLAGEDRFLGTGVYHGVEVTEGSKHARSFLGKERVIDQVQKPKLFVNKSTPPGFRRAAALADSRETR